MAMWDDAVRRPSRTGLDAKPSRGRDLTKASRCSATNSNTYWSIVTRTELDKKTFRRAVERRKQVFEVNIESCCAEAAHEKRTKTLCSSCLQGRRDRQNTI